MNYLLYQYKVNCFMQKQNLLNNFKTCDSDLHFNFLNKFIVQSEKCIFSFC